jgi:signal transduction histidine kinase
MDRARDTGQAVATGKVYVLTEAPEGSRADLALKPGLVVYLPVYRKSRPIDTVDQRQRALEGFVVASLDAEGLLRGVLESFDPSVDFEVYAGEDLTPKSLLYDDDGVLRASESQEPAGFFGTIGEDAELLARGFDISELSDLKQINLAGREYELYFEALPGEAGEQGRWLLPLFVLLSGFAVSLLLFGVTFMLVRSRVRAEKAGQDLEDTNHELEATNRELEAFSYSVSHDLRAPLRSIDGFSQILIEDYADEIDEEGKDYLGRVRAASQRMGQLIDDILGLSRVTRGTMSRERLDLGALATEVAEELRETRPERKVEFSAQKGLEVWGDPKLLRVALANLIGNAWKFTEKSPEARIEFGLDEDLSRKGRVPVYYVRDNGAGFDMTYANKLFGAFQRLHGAEEFEGTGIGLATVQRVVHRHGGRIWAEGEVDRGATFYFTLRPGLRLDPATSRKEATTK